MNPRTMRRGALALITTAAIGAGALGAVAASVPSATKSLRNGASELSYSPAKLQVKIPAGKSRIKVTLRYRNTGSTEHDIAISGRGVSKVSRTAQAGTGTAVSATLRAGTYAYFCTIPGHRAAGMKGTLRVVQGR